VSVSVVIHGQFSLRPISPLTTTNSKRTITGILTTTMEPATLADDEDIQKKPAAVDRSDDGSDVDMEGIDIDDDDPAEDDEDDKESSAEANGENDDDVDMVNGGTEERATEDHDELEAAHQEQMELMREERKRVAALAEPQDDTKASPEEKLTYLLAQSEVFAHFLAGTVAAGASGKKGGGKNGSRGKKGRMTEAEEDAQMMRAAQSKRSVIRLDKQPSLLADHCKMMYHQMDGLNWLIKLHCNGINGILADEMGLGKVRSR
jgi:SNF2 family DNA or RNA helicase